MGKEPIYIKHYSLEELKEAVRKRVSAEDNFVFLNYFYNKEYTILDVNKEMLNFSIGNGEYSTEIKVYNDNNSHTRNLLSVNKELIKDIKESRDVARKLGLSWM